MTKQELLKEWRDQLPYLERQMSLSQGTYRELWAAIMETTVTHIRQLDEMSVEDSL